MNAKPGNPGRVGTLVREDRDAFDALRDLTADSLDVDPGAIEKDYWATEVLRSATALAPGSSSHRGSRGIEAPIAHEVRRHPSQSAGPPLDISWL